MSSDDSNQSNENVSCDPSLLLVKLNEDKDKEIAKLRKWLVFVFVAFILATILSVTFISSNKDSYFILNVKFFLYFT